MANEVATYVKAIQQAKDSFTSISDCVVDFEREKYFALQICEKNTMLQNTNMLPSLAHAVRNVALCGITLNPAMKLAYLVPRDGKVCLDISYMGLIKIATDSGSVLKVNCQLVHENDFFEVEHGTVERVTHKPDPFKERGKVIGVYCVAHLKEGGDMIETMSIDDVFKIRGRSKAWVKGGSGPWATDEGEMIRKTCVKRASKYWPKTERLSEAVSVLNEHEGLADIQEYVNASPATEAANKAQSVDVSPEDEAKRNDMIADLEQIALNNGIDGYAKAFKDIGADGRKLLGAEEHERIKGMAAEVTEDASIVDDSEALSETPWDDEDAPE